MKLYVDGVAETLHTEYDNLSGSSKNSNPLFIGAQESGGLTDYDNPIEYLGPLTISNAVRSSGYIGSNSSAASFPPSSDSYTVLQYTWSEQGGSTTADQSGNGYTGQLGPSGSYPSWTTWIPATTGGTYVQEITKHTGSRGNDA